MHRSIWQCLCLGVVLTSCGSSSPVALEPTVQSSESTVLVERLSNTRPIVTRFNCDLRGSVNQSSCSAQIGDLLLFGLRYIDLTSPRVERIDVEQFASPPGVVSAEFGIDVSPSLFCYRDLLCPVAGIYGFEIEYVCPSPNGCIDTTFTYTGRVKDGGGLIGTATSQVFVEGNAGDTVPTAELPLVQHQIRAISVPLPEEFGQGLEQLWSTRSL